MYYRECSAVTAEIEIDSEWISATILKIFHSQLPIFNSPCHVSVKISKTEEAGPFSLFFFFLRLKNTRGKP